MSAAEPDREYHARRAREERDCASQAADPQAARVHRALAALHRARAQSLTQPEPTAHAANS